MPTPSVPTTCTCGQPTHHAVAATVEMEVDAAGLRIDGIPIVRCEAGHATVADPDLADRVVGAIRDQLLVARSKVLRRDPVCGDCGAALTLPGRRSDTPVPFSTPLGVVTPTVVATMQRCPTCGREQLPPDADDALAVLVDACLDEVATAP